MPSTDSATISLKVLEIQPPHDIAKSVARVHKDTMDKLGIASNGIIQLQGKRTTYAKCVPLIHESVPKDQSEGIIRIDKLTRNNLGVQVGDTVLVSKAESKRAHKVIVKTLEAIPPIDERYLADVLDGLPLTAGDKLLVPYFGGRLTFEIIKIVKIPSKADEILGKETAAVVSKQTTFQIKDENDLKIRLVVHDILKREDRTGNVVIGFTISLSFGNMTEVGEFQRVIEAKKGEKELEQQRKRIMKSYQNYNEIIQEAKSKANDRILDMAEEEGKTDEITRLLKEAKIEILSKCAEIE